MPVFVYASTVGPAEPFLVFSLPVRLERGDPCTLPSAYCRFPRLLNLFLGVGIPKYNLLYIIDHKWALKVLSEWVFSITFSILFPRGCF